MDWELLKQDSIDVIIAARLKRNIDECFSQGPRHQSRIQLSFWTYPVDLQFWLEKSTWKSSHFEGEANKTYPFHARAWGSWLQRGTCRLSFRDHSLKSADSVQQTKTPLETKHAVSLLLRLLPCFERFVLLYMLALWVQNSHPAVPVFQSFAVSQKHKKISRNLIKPSYNYCTIFSFHFSFSIF